MKKKLLIFGLVATIFFTGTAFKSDFFEIAKQIEIFTTMFKELNMNYVDETNPGDLMDKAIKNMLSDLDPYTQFYNEQDVEAQRIRRTGEYTGIGAVVRTFKDNLIIVEPYKDYPADKAGLKAGDKIIRIGETALDEYDGVASDLLKGSPNSEVKITFERQGKKQTATIKRSEIEVDAVPHYSLINEKTGYIVLSKFNRKASKQTIHALKYLKSQGAERIILDLRNNPGGLLKEAVNIVNIFVPKDQLVVTTKSKVKKYNRTYFTNRDPVDTEIPVVVLINGRSASASEIVSGALQDLDRAVIVGSRSFGKGLVQRPKPLTYGTQLKVTISRYYTPSGRCIQALDYWHRDKDGNAVRTDKKDYNEFKTKNGRKVFDGGGVFPDKLIERSKTTPITKAILKDNLIFNFATAYYYKNTISDINNLVLTNTDFNNFKSFLNSNAFSFETKTEKALLKTYKEAEKEELADNILKDYTALLEALKNSKKVALDENKDQILNLLTDEIVKRYAYREGLYDYYKIHNTEIKEATDILSNLTKYQKYLK